MPRVFTAHTPLGPEELKFHTMRGSEEIGRLFDFDLTLASPNHSIAMNAILGQSVTVEIEREDKSHRYLNGFVTEFSQTRRDGRLYVYEARVRPQLWYLTQTRDFRIFQKQSARDIIKQLLGEFGIAIKDQLTGYYRMREYCVQYGESAFDFISRLLEEEGATYWFEHSMGSHVMVLSDSISAYPTLPSHATIPFYPPDLAAIPDEEYVRHWRVSQSVNPGKYASTDYDFKKPKANLDIIQPKPRDHPHNQYEKFHFPGGYRDAGDGENYARVRIEEWQHQHEQADAETNVRGMAPGYRFSLTRCPRATENREVLVIKCDYHFEDNSYEGGAQSKVVIHDTRFTIIPSSEPFRPKTLTPRPVAHATDSAIITGPAGEEIWTDSHGRVKLHFHWDRHGPKDQNSSCWVRVSQPWAGANFGMMHIPRIGQEVLVGYVDNDPDHPIIISRVYNADTMPPWGLPGNATQSGILTRSSKGGGYDNANALRFEDKKGEEQLWLHAEKDQLTEVEHDEDKWVGNDRRKTIDRDETSHIKRDRTETVDRDETITVHGKRTEEVDGNEDITIHSNRTERVDHNETISIGDNRTEDVGANETIDIGDNQKITVGSNRTKTVKNSEDTNIGKTKTDTIGKSWTVTVGMMKNEMVGMMDNQVVGLIKTVTVGMTKMLNVGMSYMQNIGQSMTTKVGKNYRIEAGDSFEIVCGQTKIKMTKDGTIAMTGKDINISAVGSNVVVNGKEIFLNPIGGKSATTPDPTMGETPKEGAANGAGTGTPSGANGFVAGGPSMTPGMPAGGMDMGGLAGIAKQAGGLMKAASSIPGISGLLGKSAGAVGVVGGLLGSGSGSSGRGSAAPNIGTGIGDGKPGNF